jgi:S-adenosylmethionine:tRNA ribosyltransferase-isomerase
MSLAFQTEWPQLPAASDSTRLKEQTRCLVLSQGHIFHRRVMELAEFFKPGDLLVVNDAGTIPASLHGKSRGRAVEIRLVKALESPRLWWAILFGEGDWRMPTEARPPARLKSGDEIEISPGFRAKVVRFVHDSEKMVEIEFKGLELWHSIFKAGRPIQYSYLREPLALWDHQTIFSGPPVSMEPPSASFCLTWSLIEKWKQLGLRLTSITHSTGISSTGDTSLDQLLPLPEQSWISSRASRALKEAMARKSRIIAVGTGVVRALEGLPGLGPGAHEVSLRLSQNYKLQVVDGILTGLHEKNSSHLDLLEAFAPRPLLQAAYGEAERLGYRLHEYGDVNLIL